MNEEWKRKISEAKKGIPIPEERKARISATLKGRPNPRTSLSNKIRIENGYVPWNKGKLYATSRSSGLGLYKIWRSLVLKKHENKCTKCGTDKQLECHHIIPWKQDESKRFDVENGQTLCKRCHSSLECKIRGPNPNFRHTSVHTEESKRKMSEALKGKIPWSMGKKFSEEHKKKLSDAKKDYIPWNKGLKQKEQKTRTCNKCGAEKDTKMFTKGRNLCKICRNAFLRERRHGIQ